jgi:hypothetical protein
VFTTHRLFHVGLASTLSVLALAGCGSQPTPVAMGGDAPAVAGEARRLVLEDGTVVDDPSASPAGSAAPSESPAPSSSPSASPTPAPTPTPTPTPSSGMRVPNTTPITNIAGMDNNPQWQATNRSTFMDVTPDGSKVGIIWMNNRDANGNFSITGEPYAYASIGDPSNPSSFSAPTLVGQRPFDYAADATDSYKKFNWAHNAPFMLATRFNGFLGFSVPMNANGYAEKIAPIPTGYGYALAEAMPGSSSFATSGLVKLTNWNQGSSLSEMSGDMDGDGNIHLFGQGHLGRFQGGFGYQRRPSGATTLDGYTLASAYRPTGMNYFSEGSGYVAKTRNSYGKYDIHAAFSWNRQGDSPVYGLYYLRSRDGGLTWQNGYGKAVTLPLTYNGNDSQAAIVRAGLTTGGTYNGALVGASQVVTGAADNGQPFILRPIFTDSTQKLVQNWLYTIRDGKWIRVAVGPKLFWNAYGAGVAYNARTGHVNVVLLDPGSYRYPAQVLLYSQPLSSLNAVSYAWKQEVVAKVPQSHYASSMQVREVKDTRFVIMFESEYKNPGRVRPTLVEAPMR